MNAPAVLTDFLAARTPSSEYAKSLAAAAEITKADGRNKGIRGFSSGRHDVYKINPYLIIVKPGLNSRIVTSPENQEHIDALARSIAANGVKSPLTVYWENEEPVLTDGECRLLGTFRAIEIYGSKIVAIPVITELKSANETDRLLTQIISNSGKPFTPLETASVYDKLLKNGYMQQQIADLCSVSLSKVSNLLSVHALPDDLKEFIIAGKISASACLEINHNASSTESAIADIKRGIKKAERSGKTKVTQRFIEARPMKQSWKSAIIFMLDSSKIVSTDEETITISMSPTNYVKLRDLIES